MSSCQPPRPHPQHRQGATLVHYSGPWTDDERTAIEHAILGAEAARLPRVSAGYGAPWIAVKSSGGIKSRRNAQGYFYIVSRAGVDGTRRAQSASGLAVEIEAMAAG
jgi:hypothetical protein